MLRSEGNAPCLGVYLYSESLNEHANGLTISFLGNLFFPPYFCNGKEWCSAKTVLLFNKSTNFPIVLPFISQEVIKYFVTDSWEIHILSSHFRLLIVLSVCRSGNTLFHAVKSEAASCHLVCPLQGVIMKAVINEYWKVQKFAMVNYKREEDDSHLIRATQRN